ncbi:alanine racemase [Bacteroidota bacterium]
MHTQFTELDSPALLIEKSILEKNISDMQALMNKYNVRLRPHIKTHKMPCLAQKQIEAGAVGIACAKVTEALVFAAAGIKDIQIANIIVGDKKFENLIKLMDNVDKLSSCVDSIENASLLADYMAKNEKTINVLIIVDCGYGRCGMDVYDKILELAKYVQDSVSLNLLGITTHAGQAYSASSGEERLTIARHEGEFMIETADKLKADGIEINNITIGSNPTARHSCRVPGVTEIRTGNYIFNDMIQVSLGTVGIEQCALTVLTQIISTPAVDRVILDAGSKSFSSDKGAHGNENLKGYGKIIGKEAVIEKLSEEHGIVKHNCGKFYIGERLRVIPNHACTTANMFEKAYLVDGDNVLEEINIDARGMIF